MSSVSSTFANFNEYLSKDQDVRKEIRTTMRCLEQTACEIMTTVQGVHQPAGLKDVPGTCKKARGMFETVKSHYAQLKEKFPADQYYRFHDHWRFVSQRLVFLSALIVYLETEKLISREEVAEMLGTSVLHRGLPWKVFRYPRHDGRYLDTHVNLPGDFELQLHFRPGAEAKDLIRIAPHHRVREGYIFIHIGGNNITFKNGNEKEHAKDTIDSIFKYCVDVRNNCMCPNVFVSSILPRVNNNWYNDRIRYINRHVRDKLLSVGVGYIDHTRTFMTGKYNVNNKLLSLHDGLHITWLFH